MKKYIFLMMAAFCIMTAMAQVPPPPPAPPAPPAAPTIRIDGDVVTITTESGNVYIIDDYGIRKNGTMIIGDTEDLEDDIADIKEEIEDIQDKAGKISPDSEEYADLREELKDLERELEDLNANSLAIDTLPGDSTAVTIGKWRLIVKEDEDSGDDVDVSFGKVPETEEVDDHYVDPFKTEWLLFDMGYNTYLNADHKVQVDSPYADMEDLHGWGSFDVNVHIFRSRVNIAKGFIDFNYGLSMESHHFRYDRDFTILPDMDTLTITDEGTEHFDKNKFNTLHLSLPLLLGFETKPWDLDKSFRMQFGYNPGLLLRGKTKQKINGNADVVKDDFNLTTFRHEADFIIGYGDFNVYASYDINGMFSEGEGPELHPFSVGLVLRRGF